MSFIYKVKRGDTLNGIARRFGFRNYRDAGISSVPSGNFDLIRPNEEIVLNNYNPREIQGFQQGSPVVSSLDHAQQFRDNSQRLDEIQQNEETRGEYTISDEGQLENDSDPLIKSYNSYYEKRLKEEELKKQKAIKDYEEYYNSMYKGIDRSTDNLINNINNNYRRLAEEQARINRLNIDRVKAYGLSHGGQYTPISYGDAVSNREEEARKKLEDIESKRQMLIREAEQARQEGKSKLLKEKLERMDKFNEMFQKTMQSIENDLRKQVELARKLRKEEEARHQQKVKEALERFKALAGSLVDRYENSSRDEREALIQEYAEKYGLPEELVAGALVDARGKMLMDEEKVRTQKATTASKWASVRASNALAEKRRKEAENAGKEEKEAEDECNGDFDCLTKKFNY